MDEQIPIKIHNRSLNVKYIRCTPHLHVNVDIGQCCSEIIPIGTLKGWNPEKEHR